MKNYFLLFVYVLFFKSVVTAQTKSVDAVAITVKDMVRSEKFYAEVLGFKKVADTEMQGREAEQLTGLFGVNIRIVRMQLGDEFIELTDYLTAGGRSIPENQKSNDLSFQHIAIVVSDMEKAYAQVRKYHVEHVSTSPQTLPASIPAAAGIKAFYFHDPDNHNLELIYFPKDKGQTKWHKPADKIFLGIDHTAIGVSNTERSHHFYTTLLGIEYKGESYNKGNEQEHLNNVEGASLHITGHRAAKGIGVEFLEYLLPGPGQLYPADTRADDLWFWQTILFVDDAEAIYNKLKAEGFSFVSKTLVHQQLKNKHTISFIVKDPDGHAVKIVQTL